MLRYDRDVTKCIFCVVFINIFFNEEFVILNDCLFPSCIVLSKTFDYEILCQLFSEMYPKQRDSKIQENSHSIRLGFTSEMRNKFVIHQHCSPTLFPLEVRWQWYIASCWLLVIWLICFSVSIWKKLFDESSVFSTSLSFADKKPFLERVCISLQWIMFFMGILILISYFKLSHQNSIYIWGNISKVYNVVFQTIPTIVSIQESYGNLFWGYLPS